MSDAEATFSFVILDALADMFGAYGNRLTANNVSEIRDHIIAKFKSPAVVWCVVDFGKEIAPK